MSTDLDSRKYVPLTETTYYIMLSIVEPLHGYAVMQKVEQISRGTVKLGPGTLYGAISMLEQGELAAKVSEENRRKTYVLTAKGKKVLSSQIERLDIMTQNGQEVLARLR